MKKPKLSRRSVNAGRITLTEIYARCVMRGDCRLWQGALSRRGYPYIYDAAAYKADHVNGLQSGRKLVWLLKHGKPGEGVITTTCGDTLCLAHSHLACMSKSDAAKIAVAKGSFKSVAHVTARIANSRSAAKLDVEKARNIRALVAAGESAETVASGFGVSLSTVRGVVSGRSWKEHMAPNASVFFWRGAA